MSLRIVLRRVMDLQVDRALLKWRTNALELKCRESATKPQSVVTKWSLYAVQ